jgi:hypothetical protein
MTQTFTDLLNERKANQKGLFSFALWMFIETFFGLIKENIMHYKSITRISLITLSILMVPLIAMQFTKEVNWQSADFAVFGAMLLSVGLAYEFLAAKMGAFRYKAAMALALVGAFILLWGNMAVGLIGSEEEPLNLMYYAVIGFFIFGSAMARIRPHEMMRVMFVTATIQFLITLGALSLRMGELSGKTLAASVGINSVIIALFIVSALLFRQNNSAKRINLSSQKEG